MDPAHAAGNQVDDLFGRIADPRVEERGGIPLIAGHDLRKLRRELCAAERDHPLNLAGVDDRHDARLYRHMNSGLVAELEHPVEVPVVKKELGDQVGGAAFHLLAQIDDVLLEAVALGVPLGVAGRGDVEAAAGFADEPDQIARVRKFRVAPGFRRPVAPEREDVFHPVFLEKPEHRADLREGRIDAGQMGERLGAVFFEMGGEVGRHLLLKRRAARAIRHRDIVRRKGADFFGSGVDRLDRILFFRRKDLDRKEDVFAFKFRRNFHG